MMPKLRNGHRWTTLRVAAILLVLLSDHSVVYSFGPAVQLIQRQLSPWRHVTNRRRPHWLGRIAYSRQANPPHILSWHFPHSTTATKTAPSRTMQKHSRRWLYVGNASSESDNSNEKDENTDTTTRTRRARLGPWVTRFWPWSRRTVSAQVDDGKVATTTTTPSSQCSETWNPDSRLLQRLHKQQSKTQWSTLLRVGGPSLLAGFVAYLAFPAAALTLASGWSNPGTFAVLSQDASQFVQNFLTVAGLLFSILVGQTCTC
jgi:hypothetical protein